MQDFKVFVIYLGAHLNCLPFAILFYFIFLKNKFPLSCFIVSFLSYHLVWG